MKILVWLPTLLWEWVKAHSWSAVKPFYQPSTETVRVVEQDARNAARLAAYKAKRFIQ